MAVNSEFSSSQLAAARAGSREAIGQLLESYRGYLLMISRQELGPELRVKGSDSDLVQQTFLEAQRDFARFHGSSAAELQAWLRRLLLNNLMTFTRHYRATDKRALDRERTFRDGSGHRLAEGLVDGGLSPSGRAVADEQAQALQRAVERLPEDYRRVLELRHQEEHSFEEIAVVMQRSANAVRKLWVRAIEYLRKEIDHPDQE
jgi:RNA polymerase sigma-70 factor (ECF subfamily)